jgi:YidC/Oxa1 family membrane protein insertase
LEFLTLTQSNWFIIGPIAKVLGFLMNWIYEFLDLIGIPNIGIAIILFTIIIKALMLPLSIRQQKFSKLNTVMQPEIQAIQEKYKNLDKNSPKYNQMLMQEQEDMKMVYQKYGTSPTGGCLQLLIQMPILFALYQVIYKIPGYVTKIYNIYKPVAEGLVGISGYWTEELQSLASQNEINVSKFEGYSDTQKLKHIIDMFYNFSKSEWSQFTDMFPQLTDLINQALPQINRINYFLGVDLATPPSQQLWPGIFIPILAGLTQWLSSKMVEQPQDNDDNGTAATMKTMNIIMPLISVVFCFTLSAGLGVYWIASAVVQIIIQLIVNKYMETVDINKMVEENVQKANAKRVKRGQKPIRAQAAMNVHTIEEQEEARKKKETEIRERTSAHIEKSTEYYKSTNTKKGKLASRANMVQQYNEKHEKNRKR